MKLGEGRILKIKNNINRKRPQNITRTKRKRGGRKPIKFRKATPKKLLNSGLIYFFMSLLFKRSNSFKPITTVQRFMRRMSMLERKRTIVIFNHINWYP